MKFDDKIQLIMVGESCVGKTSILYKYTQGLFTNQHLATVGLEFFTKEETINGKLIRVKIWDTAGQEQYKSLTKNFYRNADGVIICYDVSDRTTFDRVQEWVQSIEDYTSNERNIQKILVGNKVDLPRQVLTEEGQSLAAQYNIPFFEVSAKENIGIENFMKKIIEDVINNSSNNKKGVDLNSPDTSQSAKKGCGC